MLQVFNIVIEQNLSIEIDIQAQNIFATIIVAIIIQLIDGKKLPSSD